MDIAWPAYGSDKMKVCNFEKAIDSCRGCTDGNWTGTAEWF